MDFIEVYGEVISYNNALQLNIKQIRVIFKVVFYYLPKVRVLYLPAVG